MCQLLETIRVEKGTIQNIEFHNHRFNKARKELFGIDQDIDLKDIIPTRPLSHHITYKCRIIYSTDIQRIEFQPYQPKIIRSLQIVEANTLDYSFKYADRSVFSDLLSQTGTDEILIVQNGFITDTSYSNVAFRSNNRWITPSTFLLNGTKRQSLIQDGDLVVDEIKLSDLRHFKSMKLINAMLDLEDSPEIPTKLILS
jgi:4-amino-4-deoxychorismate lyase